MPRRAADRPLTAPRVDGFQLGGLDPELLWSIM